MEQEPKIGEPLGDLESQLHELAPLHARLDTAQTLFLAGQQSMRRQQRLQAFWPLSSACLAVVCITLGVLVARPTEPQVVYVPREEPADRHSIGEDERSNLQPQKEFQQHGPASRATIAAARPSESAWHDLEVRMQRQQQLLDGSWDVDAAEPSAGEPAIVEAVSYSDWPALLTDQSVGERFRSLAEPYLQPSASAIQYVTTLFPTRGS